MTAEDKIKFIQYDKPVLEAGTYIIEFKQLFGVNGATQNYSHTAQIAVYGERFTINPDLIHAKFPPEENLGNYSSVLPHLSFERSTFPWERSAYGNDDYEPWLALLLFDESEFGSGDVTEPQIVSLGDLKNPSDASPYFPGIDLEDAQKENDKVTVIDVKKSLLEKIVPSGEELSLLAHVRERGKDVDGSFAVEEGFAVLVCNRLPKVGSRSTVHLVSMEGRYHQPNGTNIFNYQTTNADDFIRLVSLKSWSFSCLEDQPYTFEELINDIQVGTLRLPVNANTQAESYLKLGYAHLPHRIRQGSKTVSWYRGPLSTWANAQKLSGRIEDADQLLRYHENIGMFDISYACAYELGRMLALDSDELSTALYRWKRANKQITRRQAIENDERDFSPRTLTLDMFALEGAEASLSEQKTLVNLWFEQLSKLEGVPFHYLVPDEAMLPQESIRFFMIDKLWVDCLLRGAFSIGRVTTSDLDNEQDQLSEVMQNDYPDDYPVLSGFLIRSQLVSGWPDLQVDAYTQDDADDDALPSSATPLAPVRIDYLAEDVLLCLFEGEVKTAEVYLKPQAIQFGLDKTVNGFEKEIRLEGITDPTISVPFRHQQENVLNVTELATRIGAQLHTPDVIDTTTITSARFGKFMIEGVPKGRFVKSDS